MVRWRKQLGIAFWCAGFAALSSSAPEHTHALTPSQPWQSEPGWISVDPVPFSRQSTERASGSSALQVVIDHICGAPAASIAAKEHADRHVTAGELRDRARRLGFDAYVVSGTLDDIKHELVHDRPVIVGVAKPSARGQAVAHYEVVIGIHPTNNRIVTLDPADGGRQTTFAGFLEEWTPTQRLLLVVLPGAHGLARGCAN